MELLELLAANAGSVLNRAEIEAALWSGVAVTHDAVPQAIKKLRRALEDSATEPRFIKTYPKRGYSLIASVEEGTISAASESTETVPDVEAPSGMTRSALVSQLLSLPQSAQFAVFSALAAAVFLVALATTNPANRSTLVSERLLTRADQNYARFTLDGAQNAVKLYQRVLITNPHNIRAQNGLASARMQLVRQSLVFSGHLDAPSQSATQNLVTAWELGGGETDHNGTLTPGNTAQREAVGFDRAMRHESQRLVQGLTIQYQQSPDSWDTAFQLAELHFFLGRTSEVADLLTGAYETAPGDRDHTVAAHLALLIALQHDSSGHREIANQWYRQAGAANSGSDTTSKLITDVLDEKSGEPINIAPCEYIEQQSQLPKICG